MNSFWNGMNLFQNRMNSFWNGMNLFQNGMNSFQIKIIESERIHSALE